MAAPFGGPTPAGSKKSQVDMFVKIKAVKQGVLKGESKDKKHKDEIDVESYQWDVTQPVDKFGAGLGTGKRVHGPFSFVIVSQAATPKLLTACCTGEVLSEVTFTCRKAGGQQQEYIIWKLTNAVVHKVETGFLVDEDLIPHDKISLLAQKIELNYSEQKADGNLGAAVMFSDDWVG